MPCILVNSFLGAKHRQSAGADYKSLQQLKIEQGNFRETDVPVSFVEAAGIRFPPFEV